MPKPTHVSIAMFLLLGAALTFARQAPVAQGAALPAHGWPTNGGDVYNRRFSPLTEIDRSNVGRLKAAWRTRLGSGLGIKYSGEAQLLVDNGVIYAITGANDLF